MGDSERWMTVSVSLAKSGITMPPPGVLHHPNHSCTNHESSITTKTPAERSSEPVYLIKSKRGLCRIQYGRWATPCSGQGVMGKECDSRDVTTHKPLADNWAAILTLSFSSQIHIDFLHYITCGMHKRWVLLIFCMRCMYEGFSWSQGALFTLFSYVRQWGVCPLFLWQGMVRSADNSYHHHHHHLPCNISIITHQQCKSSFFKV